MAIESICAKLLSGQDSACVPLKRRYFQQAVIINKSDIDQSTVVLGKTDYAIALPVCAYNVQFTLKTGKTGYLFAGPQKGDSFFGSFDKTNSDLGFTQYKHNASILIAGASEEAKCILESLDKGSFVVAYQFTDGTIEIYGFENAMNTADYTWDLQGGGGGATIVLSSNDNSPENYLPLIYKSGTLDGETADFDSLFANI